MAAPTPAYFRTVFPMFADTAVYPDAAIQFQLDFAVACLVESRWTNLYNQGLMLFAAHFLTLWKQQMDRAAAGGAPGTVVGVQSGKTVDKASVTYDTGLSGEEGAGHWNLTIYGSQFYRMVMIVGMGPVHFA